MSSKAEAEAAAELFRYRRYMAQVDDFLDKEALLPDSISRSKTPILDAIREAQARSRA
jgi:hypothetical protein